MREFVLHRGNDVTGVSGTGVVADGVEFADGVAVLHWRGEVNSTVVYGQGLAAVRHIHGHGGATELVFPDEMVDVHGAPEGIALLRCPDCSWEYELVPGATVQSVQEMARAHYLNAHLA